MLRLNERVSASTINPHSNTVLVPGSEVTDPRLEHVNFAPHLPKGNGLIDFSKARSTWRHEPDSTDLLDFDTETAKELRLAGYLNHVNRGESVLDLIDRGLRVMIDPALGHKLNFAEMMSERTPARKVAVPPANRIFLPDSAVSYDEQVEILAEANERFQRRFPGAELIRGTLGEQLSRMYGMRTIGMQLFNYGAQAQSIQTATAVVPSNGVGRQVVTVGYGNELTGALVGISNIDQPHVYMPLAPIIVPRAR